MVRFTKCEGQLNSNLIDKNDYSDEEIEAILQMSDRMYHEATRLFIRDLYEETLLVCGRGCKVIPKKPPFLRNLARLHYLRAFCFMCQKKYMEMLEELNTAVDMNPEDDEFLYWRGHAYLSLGDFENAISDFEQIPEHCVHHNGAQNLIRTAKLRRSLFRAYNMDAWKHSLPLWMSKLMAEPGQTKKGKDMV